MALNAANIQNKNTGDRVEQAPVEPGVYPARIVQILDLGLQAQRPFQGKEKPPAQEISITYELVDTFCVDKDGKELEDKPRWISETLPLYSISQDKAKSTQRYVAADPSGKFGGDFSKLVNAPVNVTIVHNKVGEKTYVNVAGIAAMRPRDEAKCPELVNPAKVFDLDAPDMEIFGSLPQWIQDKIKKNLKFNGSPLDKLLSGGAKKEPEKEPEKVEPPIPADNGQDTPWD